MQNKVVRIFIVLLSLLILTSLASETDQKCQTDENGVCVNSDGPNVPSAASHVKIAKGSNEKGEPPKASFDDCRDRYDKCQKFAEQGECDKNPGWMIVSCPASCNACHLRDSKVRCNRKFLNISTEPIYKPNDMHDMFSTIQERLGHKYEIEVLSLSPYVVSFNNFISDDEANAILAAVQEDWERSTDSGKENEFGETGRTLSQGRTSSNAWCRQNCMDDPHVQNVLSKMEEVTWYVHIYVLISLSDMLSPYSYAGFPRVTTSPCRSCSMSRDSSITCTMTWDRKYI
ncbi:hypothetical protein EON65_27460 [archaeon]|nr:MAG: hypothetical protein EON65_27460 [archaeon]